ncbi:MAG TPA: hypothetical protein VEX43_06025 [Chthoniobacterales bacterium]|nr:hypothetical protein [Chthoniobacterales bacterium]
MATYNDQLADYLAGIAAVGAAHGEQLGERCGGNAQPLVQWIHWYRMRDVEGEALELLTGAEASIREAAGCVAIGLGRAAITAIRTQLDLLIGYTYFREHPAEWRRVCDTGEGFKLKAELLRYHADYTPGFTQRRALLLQQNAPSLDDVYATLSAHVHGQSKYSVPEAKELKDLVWSERRLREITELQHRSAQAASFFFLAIHGREWRDIPSNFVSDARGILTTAQEPIFFE